MSFFEINSNSCNTHNVKTINAAQNVHCQTQKQNKNYWHLLMFLLSVWSTDVLFSTKQRKW